MNTDPTARLVRIILSACVALGLLAAAIRPSLVCGSTPEIGPRDPAVTAANR